MAYHTFDYKNEKKNQGDKRNLNESGLWTGVDR